MISFKSYDPHTNIQHTKVHSVLKLSDFKDTKRNKQHAADTISDMCFAVLKTTTVVIVEK